MSSLMIVRRGEKVPDADQDPGNPLYVRETLLYPNMGTPLKAGVDKELPFYFTVYLGPGDDPKATAEVLQNARPLARVPLGLERPTRRAGFSRSAAFPSTQLAPGWYELRVTVHQGTAGISHTTPFRIIG